MGRSTRRRRLAAATHTLAPLPTGARSRAATQAAAQRGVGRPQSPETLKLVLVHGGAAPSPALWGCARVSLVLSFYFVNAMRVLLRRRRRLPERATASLRRRASKFRR